jgi:peptide/nickel transport system permease protein
MIAMSFAAFRSRAFHETNKLVRFCRRNPMISMGAVVILMMAVLSIGAPFLTGKDPRELDPVSRLMKPSPSMWFGADALGRDLWTRTLYGGRVSLAVGATVGILATVLGLFIGLFSGYFRTVDAILMRVMDGMMAIPAILLAIALATLTRPSVPAVIFAITVPSVPRIARLVRSVVLSVREQLYVEAAIASGTGTLRVLLRHILPNTLAPLMVEATYVCASAIITEAYLSFLGAGTPLEIPSWGNIMAEGRVYFHQAPWMILIPGIFVALTVLAINILGDGLRDMLDPRIARSL